MRTFHHVRLGTLWMATVHEIHGDPCVCFESEGPGGFSYSQRFDSEANAIRAAETFACGHSVTEAIAAGRAVQP